MTLSPEQFSLFSTRPGDPTRPGDQTYAGWLKRDDVQFHGTFRTPEQVKHFETQNPIFQHLGTRQSALDRLDTLHESGTRATNASIYARRVPGTSYPDEIYPDMVANDAVSEASWGSSRATPETIEAAETLKSGRPVSYRNLAEDIGSISHVIKSDRTRSYFEDLEHNSTRPENIREWAGRMSDLPVAIPHETKKFVHEDSDPNKQLRLGAEGFWTKIDKRNAELAYEKQAEIEEANSQKVANMEWLDRQ